MGYYDNCECAQGIEYFIDPRLYTPIGEGQDLNLVDIPEWDAKLIKQEEEAAALAAATEKECNVLIDPDRMIRLVAQRNVLVNQGFVHLVAYQIKSFYVQLNSLDKSWRNADVSLIFSNKQAGESVTVPVLELGKPVIIPASVLVPGELNIVAIAVTKVGDYSVITTDALTYQVYDPHIAPVSWPKLKDYDLYFYYQSLAKKLLAEVKELRDQVPVHLVGALPVTIKSTSTTDQTVAHLDYRVDYDEFYVNYKFGTITVDLPDENAGYEVSFKVPNEEIGVNNVTGDEYRKVAAELVGSTYQIGAEEGAEPITIDFDASNMPEVKFTIPARTGLGGIKLSISNLEFKREPLVHTKN